MTGQRFVQSNNEEDKESSLGVAYMTGFSYSSDDAQDDGSRRRTSPIPPLSCHCPSTLHSV